MTIVLPQEAFDVGCRNIRGMTFAITPGCHGPDDLVLSIRTEGGRFIKSNMHQVFYVVSFLCQNEERIWPTEHGYLGKEMFRECLSLACDSYEEAARVMSEYTRKPPPNIVVSQP